MICRCTKSSKSLLGCSAAQDPLCENLVIRHLQQVSTRGPSQPLFEIRPKFVSAVLPSTTADSVRGTSTKRKYFWLGGLLALVLWSWMGGNAKLRSAKN